MVSEQADPVAPSADVVSVADFNRRIRRAVEGLAPEIWLEGEVGSFKEAASGHLYFTLKDEREDASLDCVMYRHAALRARKTLADGSRVHVHGKTTFWSPRGRLQFVADGARPAGRGALLEALEKLKAKLLAEGLFSPDRKRPLPTDPRIIGVVTSASGAAIHDIAKVAFRRGGAHLLLAPALVQGAEAAGQMIAALDRLERVPNVDVIILGRGGGASEDLAAFQDEALVRRVAACRVPVVSAVGHEVDVTLTDLVADARAATPSQAAEMFVPDRAGRVRVFSEVHKRLRRAMGSRLSEDQLALTRLRARLGDPRATLGEHQQLLDDLHARLREAGLRALTARRQRHVHLAHHLAEHHPRSQLLTARGSLHTVDLRLRALAARRLDRSKNALGSVAARLHELSPLAVLARGYSIVLRADGRALVRSHDTRIGEELHLRLHEGQAVVHVTALSPPPTHDS